MSDNEQDKGQRRVIGPRKQDETQRPEPELTGRQAVPSTPSPDRPRRDAASDAASEVERLRAHEEKAARSIEAQRDLEAGRPHRTPIEPDSDIAREQRAKAHIDAELAEKIAIGHEIEDVRTRPFILLGIGSFVVLAVVFAMVWGLYSFLGSRPTGTGAPITDLDAPREDPPGPGLQVDPPMEWAGLRDSQYEILESYGYADQATGTIRIPIERAMDLLAERGLPVQEGSTRQFGGSVLNLDPSGGQSPEPTPQQQ